MAGVDEHLRPLLIAIAEATILGTAPVPAYHPSNGIAYMTDITLDNVEHFVGKNLGTSDWIEVDQSRIDQFAECTGDRQWIHVDVERAERESPFQTTIAHGYLSLSLVAALAMDLGFAPKDASVVINYGLDRVRFIKRVSGFG
jgi:acyl dehydratase